MNLMMGLKGRVDEDFIRNQVCWDTKGINQKKYKVLFEDFTSTLMFFLFFYIYIFNRFKFSQTYTLIYTLFLKLNIYIYLIHLHISVDGNCTKSS